jgi:hypothetical protein
MSLLSLSIEKLLDFSPVIWQYKIRRRVGRKGVIRPKRRRRYKKEGEKYEGHEK